jgi:hypothetical protein
MEKLILIVQLPITSKLVVCISLICYILFIDFHMINNFIETCQDF